MWGGSDSSRFVRFIAGDERTELYVRRVNYPKMDGLIVQRDQEITRERGHPGARRAHHQAHTQRAAGHRRGSLSQRLRVASPLR